MTSLTRSPNHVTHVPRPKLHHQELRFQEFEVKSLVNLLSLIMGEVPINPQSKLQFLLMYDGATS